MRGAAARPVRVFFVTMHPALLSALTSIGARRIVAPAGKLAATAKPASTAAVFRPALKTEPPARMTVWICAPLRRIAEVAATLALLESPAWLAPAGATRTAMTVSVSAKRARPIATMFASQLRKTLFIVEAAELSAALSKNVNQAVASASPTFCSATRSAWTLFRTRSTAAAATARAMTASPARVEAACAQLS